MKVAHLAIITPGRCGLYETTHELVTGLRVLGVDSRLVDPGGNQVYPDGYPHETERGIPVASMGWAVDADVLVSHSGYDGTPVSKTNQPVIYVAHGRPYNSFMTEVEGGPPIYSYQYNKNKDDRIKSVVTFWPEHVDLHRVMFPDKPVDLVQAPVDLNEWTDGPARYKFNGKGGDINVVCTDSWRQDVGPYLPLNAFALWARENPGAKLHLYAAPKKLKGYSAIIKRIQDDGNMGEIVGWVRGLKEIYRSADLMITGNSIDTRTVREAMACGCPALKVPGDFSGALLQTRTRTRAQAESWFDPMMTAVQFKRILDRLGGCKW